MSVPFFSVIVPVYNSSSYLTQCLQSIDQQGFDDFEIVIVNDGSTDESPALIEEFAGRTTRRCKVVSQVNMGLPLARKAGISASSGVYIISLDSDDLLHVDALDRIHEKICHYKADILQFGLSVDSKYSIPFRRSPVALDVLYEGAAFEELRSQIIETDFFNNLASKAVKRCLIDLSRDYVEADKVNMYEDMFQSFAFIDRAESLYLDSSLLYYYRPNPSSMVSQSSLNYIDSTFIVHSRVLKLSRSWGTCESVLTTQVQKSISSRLTELALSNRLSTVVVRDYLNKFSEYKLFRNAICAKLPLLGRPILSFHLILIRLNNPNLAHLALGLERFLRKKDIMRRKQSNHP